MTFSFENTSQILEKGVLYMVPTPIGNIADIGIRALKILEDADVICAEDTRVTGTLLARYGIRKKLWSVREHNENEMAVKIIEALRNGLMVAEVSDAGTPGVCDPGARVARRIWEAGLKVVPVPGPNAVTTAISGAGIIWDGFDFLGFLPAKRNERKEVLKKVCKNGGLVVFYESPHRIMDSIKDMVEILPTRKVTLVRELTKIHETFLQGSPEELRGILENNEEERKGEMVLLVHPKENRSDSPPTNEGNAKGAGSATEGYDSVEGSNSEPEGPIGSAQLEISTDLDTLARMCLKNMGPKSASIFIQELTGLKKNEVYKKVLQINDEMNEGK